MTHGFDLPEDASPAAARVHEAIMAVLNDAPYELSTGGGRAFYTPEEWRARGEQYGRESVLIVVHDGGDHAHYFNPDYEGHHAKSIMDKALDKIGCYAEPCTCWYTAVYQDQEVTP